MSGEMVFLPKTMYMTRAEQWTAREDTVLSIKMEGEIIATANKVSERRFH